MAAKMEHDMEPLILNEDDVERGGKEYRDSISGDFAYKNNVANASVRIRLGFIRKVYSLLAFQLFVTIVLSAVAVLVPVVQFFITNNDWLVLVSFVASFVTLLALFVYRRQHPHNLLLLTVFTIAQSMMLAVVISRFDAVTVLQAFGLTFVVVVGLTMYTLQTTRDFTSMGAGLSAGLLILITAGFLQLLFGGTALEFLISVGGALLFSMFIIYDTQVILEKSSPEEYILATINLYLDIINLFLYILRILAEAKKQ